MSIMMQVQTFININEHMALSRQERRSHLRLEESCIEIGGASQFFRGLLAHYLGTTIGDKSSYVCHACNNPGCSNPRHLYWGTPSDNVIDQKEAGTWKSGYQKMVDKYGKDTALKIARANASKGGKAGGGHNALTDSEIESWREAINAVDTLSRGFINILSKKMNCSHTHTRRILNKYFPEVQTFKRRTNNPGL